MIDAVAFSGSLHDAACRAQRFGQAVTRFAIGSFGRFASAFGFEDGKTLRACLESLLQAAHGKCPFPECIVIKPTQPVGFSHPVAHTCTDEETRRKGRIFFRSPGTARSMANSRVEWGLAYEYQSPAA